MKKAKYRILTLFDFDEEGCDVSGIEIEVNLENMEKQFANVESMLDMTNALKHGKIKIDF